MAVAIAFAGNRVSATDTATYTFTSHAIGSASADRKVVVGIWARAANAVTISSVTIGGNAANEIVQIRNPTGGSFSTIAGFYELNVAAGTTATIVVTFSNTMVRCGIGVWAVTGHVGAINDWSTDAGDPSSLSVDALAGGGIIAIGGVSVTGGTATTALGGGITSEDFDAQVENSSNRYNGGHATFGSAQSSLAVTNDWGGTGQTPAFAIAAFRPPNQPLDADTGGVAATGRAVALRAARRLAANVKNIATVGQSVNLTVAADNLVISPDDAAVAGQSVALRASRRLSATTKNIAVAGQAVALRAARRLAETVGAVTVGKNPTNLRAARRLAANPDDIQVQGQTVELDVQRLDVALGNVAVASYAVDLRYNRVLIAQPRDIAVASVGARVDRLFKLISRSPVVTSPARVTNVTSTQSLTGQVITSPTRHQQITG